MPIPLQVTDEPLRDLAINSLVAISWLTKLRLNIIIIMH